MAKKSGLASVDQYISVQRPKAQPVLERVRRDLLRRWKEHYSLYPVGPAIVAALADDLDAYQVEKSTIRFPLARAVPAALIARIAKMRAQEAGRQHLGAVRSGVRQPSRRGSSGSSR